MVECAREIRWITNLFEEANISPSKVLMYQDNQSAIKMANKPKFSKRTRYIELRHLFLLDMIEEKVFEVD